MHANGKTQIDPASETVTFYGGDQFALHDTPFHLSFDFLEVAYLATRQVMLQKKGTVAVVGGPSLPGDGAAPVPHSGTPNGVRTPR